MKLETHTQKIWVICTEKIVVSYLKTCATANTELNTVANLEHHILIHEKEGTTEWGSETDVLFIVKFVPLQNKSFARGCISWKHALI